MSCPACRGSEVNWTAQLGNLVWSECRDCGMEYSRRAKKRDRRKRSMDVRKPTLDTASKS